MFFAKESHLNPVLSVPPGPVPQDLIIITGSGVHSAERGKAVVKEAVMHVLQEQLGLPVIAAFSNVTGKKQDGSAGLRERSYLSDSDNNEQAVRYTNQGRVIVPRKALNDWLAKPRYRT